jgi:hypothetical protein
LGTFFVPWHLLRKPLRYSFKQHFFSDNARR